MRLIYLASPYSHPLEAIRILRYEAAIEAAAKIMDKTGAMVYAPIVHNHPIARKRGAAEHDFWLPRDIRMLRCMDEMWVLELEGWAKSKGIEREAEVAEIMGLDCMHVTPKYVGIKDVPL